MPTIAIDGHVTGHFNASSGQVTFNTAVSSDEIVVCVQIAGTATVSSVTGDKCTFSQRTRKTNGSALGLEVWYGGWNAHGATVITVNLSASSPFTIEAFAIKNLPSAAVWDANISLPKSGTGSSTAANAGTASTSTAADFLFATVAAVSGATQSLVQNNVFGQASTNSFSDDTGLTSSDVYGGFQFRVSSATQTSQSSGATLGLSAAWVILADAVAGFTDTTIVPVFGTDGNAQATLGTAAISGSVTLTTTQADDLIIVVMESNGTHEIASISSISGGGLTWQEMPGMPYQPAAGSIDVYYAVALSPLSSATITVTIDSTGSKWSIDCFAVRGANIATPFDSNASLPGVATGASGTTPTVSGLSTSGPNDMIVALIEVIGSYSGAVGSIAGSLASRINNPNQTGQGGQSEYLVVAGAQSGISATFASESVGTWDMVVFAIQEAAMATASAGGQASATVVANSVASASAGGSARASIKGLLTENGEHVFSGSNPRLTMKGVHVVIRNGIGMTIDGRRVFGLPPVFLVAGEGTGHAAASTVASSAASGEGQGQAQASTVASSPEAALGGGQASAVVTASGSAASSGAGQAAAAVVASSPAAGSAGGAASASVVASSVAAGEGGGQASSLIGGVGESASGSGSGSSAAQAVASSVGLGSAGGQASATVVASSQTSGSAGGAGSAAQIANAVAVASAGGQASPTIVGGSIPPIVGHLNLVLALRALKNVSAPPLNLMSSVVVKIDSSVTLKLGDYGFGLNFTIYTDNGDGTFTIKDLTGLTATLKVYRGGASAVVLLTKTLSVLSPPTNGVCEWNVAQTNTTTLGVGSFTAEVQLTAAGYQESTSDLFQLQVVYAP